jgi:hypothetical protein
VAKVCSPHPKTLAFTAQKRCTGVSKSRKRRLGRSELKAFADWSDGRPETELNFKFYRQATNKIVGISDEAAKFLGNFF